MMQNLNWIVSLAMVPGWALCSGARGQDPCQNCVRDAQGGRAWCEDFEHLSGPNPQCYDSNECAENPEIPRGCNDWYAWCDNSTMGVLTCEQNNTPGGEQSIRLDEGDHTVRVFDGYTEDAAGFWIVTVHVFIPADIIGAPTLGLVADYEIDCPEPPVWGWQFDDLSLIENQWIEIRLEVNLAGGRIRVFYDGFFLSQVDWPEDASRQIRGIEFHMDGPGTFFADDLSVWPVVLMGDGDGDFDVDVFDYELFLECVSGPGGGVGPGCEAFDFECDDDVDLSDAGAFQRAFTG